MLYDRRLYRIYIFTDNSLTCYMEFEDTKVVIRIRISKKNRQHNGQKVKYKQRFSCDRLIDILFIAERPAISISATFVYSGPEQVQN